MKATGHNRRQFLKGSGAAAAGVALAGIRPASAQTAPQAAPRMPARRRPVTAGYAGSDPDAAAGYYDPSLGPNQPEWWPADSAWPPDSVRGGASALREWSGTPQEDLVGVITPNHLMFYVTHRDLVPNLDARKHRLLIHGLVDRPLMFTMDDLKRLPSVTRVHYVACAANGGGIGFSSRNASDRKSSRICGSTGCCEWTGVLLSTVLEMVVVQKGSNWMVADSSDMKKHSMDIPLAKAMDDAILAYGQNGEPLTPGHGYPLRLIVPGFEGTRNVKWLRRIKLTDRPYWTYYENVAYSNLKPDGKARNFQYEMEVGSIITFPSGEQRLPGPGMYEI